MKLIGGQIGSTEAIPGDSTAGMWVQVKNIPQVAISSMPPVTGSVVVTGAVGISSMPAVSGTVTISNGASVTIQQGVSVSAVVSGTVAPIDRTTAHPGISASAAVVRAVVYGSIVGSAAYQEIFVDSAGQALVTGTVLVNGTVTISNGASVSVNAINTVVTQLGTAVVTIAQTSVVAQASGTVTVIGYSTAVSGSVTPLLASTTAAPAADATGILVWQVNPAVSVTVSITNISTVGTVLGTVNVAIVAGAGGGGSVTTAGPSISATGQVMWVAGGQGTTANPVVITGTVTAGAGTTVISGTVSVSGTVAVTGTIQNVATVATILGTQIVSVVPGVSVNLGSLATVVATTTASSGQTGLIVWVGNPGNGTTVISGTVSVSGTVAVNLGTVGWVGSTTAVSGVSGPQVWLGASQTVIVNTIAAGFSVNALVTGAVSISAMPVVSVTGALISVVSTILGTQIVSVVPGVSVVAQASGTVTANVSGIVPVTTAASVSVAGLPVWLNPTQQVVVSGLAGQSVSAVVSGTVTVNTIATILGTQIVSVVPGVSVNLGSLATVVATTTASSGQTGLIVWVGNPGNGTTVVSGTVSAIVSGTITQSGYSVTTAAPSISATGGQVWIIGGQGTTANPVVITGTVTAGAGTTVISGTVSVSGTAIVSVVPGVSVNLGNFATVVATTTASSGQTGLIVWVGNPGNGTTVVSGTVSVSGTQIVSVVPGVSVVAQASGTVTVNVSGVVPVVTAASVSVTGLPVWLNPTQQVVVSGLAGHSVSAVVSGTVNVGTVVTQLGTQIVTIAQTSVVAQASGTVTVGTGTVAALDVGRTQVMLVVTATSVGISGTMLLMTVYQGATQSTAGTTGYIVPAGKTFRLLAAAVVAQNSVTTSPVFHRMFVVQSTAAPTWTSAVPVALAVGVGASSAGVYASGVGIGIQDLPAGVTVGLAHTIGTSGGTVNQIVVNGYLFP